MSSETGHAAMIPAASIAATLSAALVYDPSVHVQTVEVDRTGAPMLAAATSEYVKWYISRADFLGMCEISANGVDVSNTVFTMGAGAGRPLPEASGAVLSFGAVAQTYAIALVDPDVAGGAPARIGGSDVAYSREHYAHDGSSATAPGPTSTAWSFGQSSVSLTLRWQTDASGAVRVTADPGANVTVNKPYNDAAADFIQIGMSGEALPPHGATSGGADVVSATIDYGERLTDEQLGQMQGSVRTVVGEPTLRLDDVAFTKALQYAINADGITREVSDNHSLRSAVDAAITSGHLRGFQAPAPITASFHVSIAGESRSGDDVSHALTPMILIRD